MLDFEDPRYDRQIRLFGAEGQRKIKEATVLVVGAGGLGSSASVYLAAAGVGRIIVVDGDVVELSNLNRQILHWTGDLGRSKAVSAAETIRGLNPEVEVEAVDAFADQENLGGLVGEADLVVDALDSFSARRLLNRTAQEGRVPLFHGAVSGFDGQVTTIIPGLTPCLRCIFPRSVPKETSPALGATCGVIGSIQAMEAVKHLTGQGSLLTGRLLIWDGRRACCDLVPIERNPGCPDCGGEEF
ncbi:MAG TPA: HesA/MoeB/ThiF family protein [Methanothrix sp.]|nr:HesA/MoeB/ThiF family protein [Methanothrix sp.]